MSDKKPAITEQVQRAVDLIDRRGTTPADQKGIRATLRCEFGLTNSSAGRRIHTAATIIRSRGHTKRADQIARTLAQLDTLIDDAKTPATTRLAAIKERISLLGLQPGNNGDPAPGAPQAPYPTDLSLRGPAEDPAVALARQKATDNTDEKPTPLL